MRARERGVAGAADSAKAKGAWRQWRRFILCNLASLLALLVLSGVSIFAFYGSKKKDVATLTYLTTERLASRVGAFLVEFRMRIAAGSPLADVVLKMEDNGRLGLVKGDFTALTEMENFDAAAFGRALHTILQYNGVNYYSLLLRAPLAAPYSALAREGGRYLLLWKFDLKELVRPVAEATAGSFVYFISKEGKVIYTSDEEITAASVGGRPLIKEFTTAMLGSGQTTVEGGQEQNMLANFVVVKDSNLAGFHEVPYEQVYLATFLMAKKVLLATGGVFLLFFILFRRIIFKAV